jgi:putative alpha-1,2-mannosidase
MTAPFTIFNNATNFMESRNANGSLAGQDAGWTEGDMWIYSFDVVHAIDKLIVYRGGESGFVDSLNEHFDGGALYALLYMVLLTLCGRSQRSYK